MLLIILIYRMFMTNYTIKTTTVTITKNVSKKKLYRDATRAPFIVHIIAQTLNPAKNSNLRKQLHTKNKDNNSTSWGRQTIAHT